MNRVLIACTFVIVAVIAQGTFTTLQTVRNSLNQIIPSPKFDHSLVYARNISWFDGTYVAGQRVYTRRDLMISYGGRIDTTSNVPPTDAVEVYDFRTQTWYDAVDRGSVLGTSGYDGPGARFGHSAVIIDSTMYVFGGSNGSAVSNELWGFDLLNFAWFYIGGNRIGTTRPPPTTSAPTTAAPTTIDPTSNVTTQEPTTQAPATTNTPTTADPTAATTQPVPTWPNARHGHCMVAIGKTIYMFGGHSTSTVGSINDIMSDFWMYSVLTRRWTRVSATVPAGTSGPGPRSDHTCVSPDFESILVFGGRTSGGALKSDFWRYVLKGTDVFSGNWFQIVANNTNSPRGRYDHAAVLVQSHRLMYILGGSTGAAVNDVWYYDYKCNVWVQNVNNNGFTARSGLAAVAVNNNTIGIVGGRGDQAVIQNSVSYSFTISTQNIPVCKDSNNVPNSASSIFISIALIASSLLALFF